MKKRLIGLLIGIILLLVSLAAANPITITFNSPENPDFSGYLATVTFGDALYKEKLSGPSILVPASNFGQTFEAILDSSSTPASDFYGLKMIAPNSNKLEMAVYPIGYLQGRVVDKEGNLLPKAKLSFTCYSPIALSFPEKTDVTGHFAVPKVPIGKCSIVAYTNDGAGESEFEIKQGEVTEIDISISSKIIQENSYVWLVAIIIVLLVLGLGGYLIYQKYIQKKIKSEISAIEDREIIIESETRPQKQTLPKQTQALITTLSDKEKAIVKFLMENNNQASQAKIRHATQLPRTTLARTLQLLERKKLVQIDKEGKMVDVKLTGLFLGK